MACEIIDERLRFVGLADLHCDRLDLVLAFEFVLVRTLKPNAVRLYTAYGLSTEYFLPACGDAGPV